MSSLRQQVSGMIDTCKAVMARKEKDLPSVDETSANLALSILEQAQEEMPGDKFLATVRLPGSQA